MVRNMAFLPFDLRARIPGVSFSGGGWKPKSETLRGGSGSGSSGSVSIISSSTLGEGGGSTKGSGATNSPLSGSTNAIGIVDSYATMPS